MASEFIELWRDPKEYKRRGNGETFYKTTNVGYDTLNNKYYGQYNKNWLLKGVQTEIDKYIKSIQSGGYQVYKPRQNRYDFVRYSPEELKETQQNLDRLTKYYSGINSNYEEFANFDQSYQEYRQDWDNLFTRNYNNNIQKEKNAQIERQNAITEARNKKVANENMLNEAKATLDSGLTINSGAMAKKQKNKETIGTGITSQAEKLADTLLGGTGLGL